MSNDPNICGNCLQFQEDEDFKVFGQCGDTLLFHGVKHVCPGWARRE